MKIPIYISLTSIFRNQDKLYKTLETILKQITKPDKIYIYLSEESYILDTGFKNKIITDKNLLKLLNDNTIINIKWVKNIGSYRKLLPILEEKWDEDCFIITIDDDCIFSDDLIKNLINDYNIHKCVISYRGFTPDFNELKNFDYIKRKNLENISLYNFSTNGAGTLWKPQFFHNTDKLIFNQDIFLKTCSVSDDIWFYIIRIKNNVNCYIGNKNFGKLFGKDGLYFNFNSKNNNNTIAFQNTLKCIENI